MHTKTHTYTLAHTLHPATSTDIFNMVELKFVDNFVQCEVLMMDELMWTSTIPTIYIKSKKCKYYLKMFLLSTTGYIFRMLLYSDKNFQ